MQPYRLALSLLMLLSLLLVGGAAQAQSSEATLRELAISAAQAELNLSTRPTSWTWVILNDVTESSLGCPLVTGDDLGRSVSVYVYQLVYPSGTYEVRVATDQSIVLPCDADFGTVTAPPGQPDDDDDDTGLGQTVCTLTPNDDVNLLAEPQLGANELTASVTGGEPYIAVERTQDSQWFLLTFAPGGQGIGWLTVNFATLAGPCATLPVRTGTAPVCNANFTTNGVADREPGSQAGDAFGVFSGSSLRALQITVDRQYIQVLDGNSAAWVPSNWATLTGDDCATLPVLTTATTTPTAPQTGACTITPNGAFANVRSFPDDTDADLIVGQIFNGTQTPVTGINPQRTWYLTAGGWVATFVVQTAGNCSNLPPVDPNTVDITAPAQPTQPTQPAQPVNPQIEFACPPNFVGYLVPQIQTGQTTAYVAPGGLPNVVRDFPSTQGTERLALIQPNRRIDRVISGPVCNEGFVWWQVSFDGTVGWTVESEADQGPDGTYYLLPTEGNAVDPSTYLQPTTPVTQPSQVPFTLIEGAGRLLAFTPGGANLLVADSATSSTVTLYDVRTGISTGNSFDVPVLRGATLTPDGDLVTTDGNGAVTYWDLQTLAVERTINDVAPDAYIGSIDLNNTGTLFVSTDCANEQAEGCATGQIELWDAEAGRVIRQQPAHPGPITQVGFNPDGSLLASLGSDGVQIWNTQSGAFVAGIAAASQSRQINAFAFTPDGAQLLYATCGQDAVRGETVDCTAGSTVRYDIDSQQEVARQSNHVDTVLAVAFSPDGSVYATGGADGFVYVLDAQTNQVLRTLDGHGTPVRELAFSPDGAQLASSDDNGDIFVWALGL